jgi:DNA-binding winged helix-turn-helix (wHTH) protein
MTPTPDPTFEPGRRVRFGLFDFNLATLALKRDGQLVNIQQQPALVLQYLVLRADRVVSREELQKAIWPSGTFVEFDFGLNTAINRIRRALGDSAGEPRYIETIPRQGYRFMVPVQHVLPVADNHPNPPGAVPVSVTPPLPMPAAYRPRVKLAAGAALILLAAGPLWLYLRRPEPSPMLEGRAFTTMPGEENRPVLSPDGTVVAFDKASAGGVQIWLQRADADSPQQLTTAPGIQRTAAWSPASLFRCFPGLLSGFCPIGASPCRSYACRDDTQQTWTPPDRRPKVRAKGDDDEDADAALGIPDMPGRGSACLRADAGGGEGVRSS